MIHWFVVCYIVWRAVVVSVSSSARVRVETLVRNRPQRKYGHHPHSLADVGLTEAEVRARFADHDAFRTELEARWAEET